MNQQPEFDWGTPVKGPSPWTPEIEARLKALVIRGLNSIQIGIIMRLSKNRITSKMRRMGLKHIGTLDIK